MSSTNNVTRNSQSEIPKEVFGCLLAFDLDRFYESSSFEANNKAWLIFCPTIELPVRGILATADINSLLQEGYRVVAVVRGDLAAWYQIDLAAHLSPQEVSLIDIQAAAAIHKGMLGISASTSFLN